VACFTCGTATPLPKPVEPFCSRLISAATTSSTAAVGSAPASATSNDRPGTPPWAARAFSIIAALTSTPTARPSRPTASAMPRVIAPVPHPTSSTARPGLSSAASRR